MTATRRFLTTVIVTCLVWAIANVVTAYLARNSNPRRLLRSISPHEKIGVAAIGNSLMAAGFDEALFSSELNQPHLPNKNLSLGATGPVDHYLIIHHMLRQAASTDCVVYGFFERQLTGTESAKDSNLIGNLAMRYYVYPDLAAKYSNFPPLDHLRFEVFRQFPLLYERGTLWSKIELLRRSLGEIGRPKAQTNQFGRTEDFSRLQPINVSEFDKQLRTELIATPKLNPALDAAFKELSAKNTRLIIVSMPMTSKYRKKYYALDSWQSYQSSLQRLLAGRGAKWIDASAWIPEDSYFSDGLHLSQAGASIFSLKLAQALRPTLPSPRAHAHPSTAAPVR